MKIVLAFVLIFSNGEFQSGQIVNGDWKTVAQCRETLTDVQSRMAADGVTSKAGCFEVTIPESK